MSIYISALDLGQAHDHSALIIAEVSGARRMVTYEGRDRETGLPVTVKKPVEMMPLAQVDVRHVERFELQTKYTSIAHQTRLRMLKVPTPRYLAVDKTGVGRGVIEHFEELTPIGITITGGANVQMTGQQDYNVPKRDLVAGAQLCVQNRVLRIAKGLPHAALLTEEMGKFRAKISASGHESFEAWREADHDDLVLALAIGIWTASQIISMQALQVLNAIKAANRGEPPQISPY